MSNLKDENTRSAMGATQQLTRGGKDGVIGARLLKERRQGFRALENLGELRVRGIGRENVLNRLLGLGDRAIERGAGRREEHGEREKRSNHSLIQRWSVERVKID